jgi:hypothetical protein
VKRCLVAAAIWHDDLGGMDWLSYGIVVDPAGRSWCSTPVSLP